MSAIDFLYSEILELIVEYGDILEHIALLTTSRTLFITFFKSYKSQILDINKYATNFQKAGLWNIINNQKRDLFFIDINIRLLLKKLKITTVVNTEITTLLNIHLDKFKVPITLFINNPYLIDIINKLISRGISIHDIINCLPELNLLYTFDNRLLIDKLIFRGDNVYEIVRCVPELITLYTFDNRLLIDKLISRGEDLYYISTVILRLIPLYTKENRLLIDKLLSRKYEIFNISIFSQKLIQFLM